MNLELEELWVVSWKCKKEAGEVVGLTALDSLFQMLWFSDWDRRSILFFPTWLWVFVWSPRRKVSFWRWDPWEGWKGWIWFGFKFISEPKENPERRVRSNCKSDLCNYGNFLQAFEHRHFGTKIRFKRVPAVARHHPSTNHLLRSLLPFSLSPSKLVSL